MYVHYCRSDYKLYTAFVRTQFHFSVGILTRIHFPVESLIGSNFILFTKEGIVIKFSVKLS